MTESIIKAHILQFSEPSSGAPSSSRLSSSLKDSRDFLEQIESSLIKIENQLVDLKNNPGDVSLNQAAPFALLESLIEQRSTALREFRIQHNAAEKALERANAAIRDRMNGLTQPQVEPKRDGTPQESSS
jgi:hypothetical protein